MLGCGYTDDYSNRKNYTIWGNLSIPIGAKGFAPIINKRSPDLRSRGLLFSMSRKTGQRLAAMIFSRSLTSCSRKCRMHWMMPSSLKPNSANSPTMAIA